MLCELKKNLREDTVSDLYEKYIVGHDVWYLSHYLAVKEPSKTYDDFKKYIAKKLKIHYNNIAIIGSAKTGISFSPKKNFKLFHAGSDVDIILVSDVYFEKFWNAYREMYYKQIPFPEYLEVSKSVFKKFISLKDPTQKHKEIVEWVKKVDPFLKDLQTIFNIKNDINYRIYDSWDSVEDYHRFGLQALTNRVKNTYPQEKAISQILQTILQNKNGNI
jgi:hypothetical protein